MPKDMESIPLRQGDFTLYHVELVNPSPVIIFTRGSRTGSSGMETERAKRLADFVSWVGANIRGDEKGEAQVFLDRFFQASVTLG